MSKTYPMAMVRTAGRIEYEERPLASPVAGHVLIQTKAVSICGSDIHTFKGKHPFSPLPAALGHELSGEIVEVGAGVTSLDKGDRVVLEPVITCGKCEFCRRGAYNLCTSVSYTHRQGQGAFAPFFTADEKQIHRLPPRVSFEAGALVEPLAVAVHAVKKSGIGLGESVAVFGAGAIGLMILAMAELSGAGEVFVADVQADRLRKARELGASGVFDNSAGDAVSAILRQAGGLGVDIAFEAVGMQATLVQTLQVLKKGGRAVVAGLNSQPEVAIPANIFVQKEISLTGTQGYCRDFQTVLKMLGSGDIDATRFISHRLPFRQLQEGFEMLTRPGSETVKVVIVFD